MYTLEGTYSQWAWVAADIGGLRTNKRLVALIHTALKTARINPPAKDRMEYQLRWVLIVVHSKEDLARLTTAFHARYPDVDLGPRYDTFRGERI